MSVLGDFDWSWRGVRVRATGAKIAFNPALAWDVWRGGLYICVEAVRSAFRKRDIDIAFQPVAPRPWYLVWAALAQGGFRTRDTARVALVFDDSTYSAQIDTGAELTLNGDCTDISKSRVAEVFREIFGYDLSLNPATATAPYLEKGEINGVHDGVIRLDPAPAKPDRVYQHLIDNRTEDGTVLDYRCPTVFGDIPLVFLKERPEGRRFDNLNTRVRLSTPEAHFSEDERLRISAFCAAMGLDWGGLDILRDAKTDRLYIVDVNKTDMGPPLALPLRHKLRAVKTLGLALRKAVIARL
jgi:hypothetical protein